VKGRFKRKTLQRLEWARIKSAERGSAVYLPASIDKLTVSGAVPERRSWVSMLSSGGLWEEEEVGIAMELQRA
jgi:hypothetical protein